jgi:hypothetical protein
MPLAKRVSPGSPRFSEGVTGRFGTNTPSLHMPEIRQLIRVINDSRAAKNFLELSYSTLPGYARTLVKKIGFPGENARLEC